MNKIAQILTGTVAALALTTLVLAKPASAAGTQVFTQSSAPGSFTFYALSSGTDNLSLLAPGTYLGQAGTLSFSSSFTGAPSGGVYSSGTASSTFEFKPTSASTYSTITSGVGVLLFDPSDPGVVLSGLNGYSFSSGTYNTTTTSLPFSFGTKETGSVQNSILINGAAPVPEASTVVSFGALLALGGLAVLRRKSVSHAA